MADRDTKLSLFTSQLPREIRNEIYRYLLLVKNARCCVENSDRDPKCAKIWPSSDFFFHPAVLRTNKQIYNEATIILYHENLFVRVSPITSSFREFIDVGGIPILYEGARGSKAQSFDHCAMSITSQLDPRDARKDDRRLKHYVIACDDLGSFCQAFLFHHDSCGTGDTYPSDIAFEVAVHHRSYEDLSLKPVSPSVQRQLLGPFAALHNVRDFKITGHVNTEYKESIIARVSRPAPSIEENVENVTRGLQTKPPRRLTNIPYSNAQDVVRKGLLAGRTVSFAFTYLDFMLECKIAMCHAKLHEWEEAHFWAGDAICDQSFHIKWTEIVFLMGWGSVDAESSESVEKLAEIVKILNSKPRESYRYDDLSQMGEKMSSKEGVESLRDLKATILEMTKRGWIEA